MVSANHPWKLVGPWYRWERAAVPEYGRRSAPALQKFPGTDFINDFLQNPQHSLVFDPLVDVVSNIDLLPAAAGGKLVGKLATLFATKPDGSQVKPTDAVDPNILKNLSRARLVPTSLRKLYQPIHDRHYLVVAELHCDVPGFPSTDRSKVCQAGFVVRRRQRIIPQALLTEARLRAQKLRNDEALLAELQEISPLQDKLAQKRREEIAAMQSAGNFESLLAKTQETVASKRIELENWLTANGIGVSIEAWFGDKLDGKPNKNIGHWRELSKQESDSDTLREEHSFPLYPLIPDPSNAKHDARGRTMYYGIVPTTSLQHSATGQARFDDVSTYEICCFVRRHNPKCPKTSNIPDCHGEVIWSLPTKAFRIAATFDPLGTSNRPVTIKMPDLREVAAQAMARPHGNQSTVKFVQPQHLSPKVKDGKASGGDMGGNTICFFSIPLITIIALFVLNLFLPIVVFIFQLWFLLLFRFCIPPQAKMDAGLDAALAAQPPGVDFDADFKVSIDGIPVTAADLNEKLKNNLEAELRAQMQDESLVGKFDNLSNNVMASLNQANTDNIDAATTKPGKPLGGVDYSSGMVYEKRREPQWRISPEGRG